MIPRAIRRTCSVRDVLFRFRYGYSANENYNTSLSCEFSVLIAFFIPGIKIMNGTFIFLG